MPPVTASRYLIQAGWDDAPHLDAKTKAELLASTPPHLRAARRSGEPSLGAGAIYPVPLDQVEIDPFPIPRHWPRGYGMDVGWNCTAAVWLAQDPSDTVWYAYGEYARGEQPPTTHAGAIKARGRWIRGAIDPAARGRAQQDGRRLHSQYEDQGLHLVQANNAVEAGIYEVWLALNEGRLRFFRTLSGLKGEYRVYRRDEKGRIVKTNDHRMDCLRYAVMTWDAVATQAPTSADAAAMTSPTVADTLGGY